MASLLQPSTDFIPSTDGVSLALHHFGGTGPPLLICHATGFHGRAYLPLAAHLVEHFSVWAVDFRGHGASTAPNGDNFGWDAMATDLLVCVDAIGVESLFAVGHSMGGASIVRAERERPGVVDAAYLFEPIIFPDEVMIESETPLSKSARRRRPTFPSHQDIIGRYGSRPPLDALHPDALRAYVEHGFVPTSDGQVTLACTPQHEALTFEAAGDFRIGDVGESALRVAIAFGDTSDGPGAIAPLVAAAMPAAVARPHPELGHFGPLESPQTIAVDIVAFLGKGK